MFAFLTRPRISSTPSGAPSVPPSPPSTFVLSAYHLHPPPFARFSGDYLLLNINILFHPLFHTRPSPSCSRYTPLLDIKLPSISLTLQSPPYCQTESKHIPNNNTTNGKKKKKNTTKTKN